MPQLVDGVRGLRLPVLSGGDHPPVARSVFPLVHRTPVLQPVVLQVQLAVDRDVTQREQRRRFLDVDVVARTPLDRRERRVRPEPFAARHRRARRHGVRIGTVALDLVEPADRVVAVRDEEHVVRDPAVIEAVRPHAGNAALRHLHHVVFSQHPPLVHRNRIDRLVVRSRPR